VNEKEEDKSRLARIVRKIPRRYFLLICVFLIGFFVAYYSFLLSDNLGNNAPDILRSLGDADAALIGFLGIITVFILTSYRDESRNVDRRLRRLEISHVRYHALSEDDAAEEYREYTSRKIMLNSNKKVVVDMARGCCYTAFQGIICFIVSILFCLFSMSELPNRGIWLAISTMGMITGITFTFYEIWVYTIILS